MLRRHKTLSIVMTLCLCLALLAPVFVAPPAAEAAMTATVQTSNTVSNQTAPFNRNMGSIRVDLSNLDAFTTASEMLVTFPTQIGTQTAVGITGTATCTVGRAPAYTPSGGTDCAQIVVPVDADNAIVATDIQGYGPGGAVVQQGGTIALKIASVTKAKEKGWFYIYFDRMFVQNFAGDFNVNLVPQQGTAFGSAPVPLVVGRVNVSGKTTTVAKSVYPITSTPNEPIDTVTVFEDIPNTIRAGVISLKIETKGYSWGTPVAGSPAALGVANSLFAFQGEAAIASAVSGSPDTWNVTVPAITRTSLGAIGIGGLTLTVDEDVARIGQDVEVKVSGSGVTEQTVIVAKYVDYNVLITEDTTTELISGREEQKLGTFFIEEVASNTLVQDRTILMELPAGVEWFQAPSYEVVNSSGIVLTNGAFMNSNRTAKASVTTSSNGCINGAKIKVKSMKVNVSPSFKGDVTLNISGTAGAKGEVKVATVTPMVTMAAEAPEVQLGIADQKVSDVTITESKAQAICDRQPGGNTRLSLAFRFDQGFRFVKVPTVEVLEGDLILDATNVKITSSATENRLIVPIKAGSYKTPAKIKISDIYVTADRTAPTGDVKMWLASTAQYTDIGFMNAANSTGLASFQYDNPGSIVVAKNVTVPPVENKNVGLGGSGTFVIGSNIYTVNGMTKIMDTAPYITSGRTYVPYRYLALALGVAPDDIVWDDSTKKVTVTKGDIVVEATIGSTTLTVNGEAQVMDVAPEIKGGRTMLPARYLAEALGGSVGWDQATKTVVFEM